MAMMDAPGWNGDIDDREFGPERDVCEHCGGDLIDEGHEPSCEWNPDFFQQPVAEVEP
jgi:hypothetical protein